MTDSILRGRIKKLRGKAEKSRNAHGLLYKKFKRTSDLLHILTLVGSSIVALLTFADFDDFLILFNSLTGDIYQLSIGITASMVFILLVLEEFLSLNKKAASHENAVKQLTTFIRLADSIEKNKSVKEENVSELTSQYTLINENAPLIPDKIFLKSKQRLNRKICLSKTMDTNPFVPFFIIKLFFIMKAAKKFLFNEKKSERKEDEGGDF